MGKRPMSESDILKWKVYDAINFLTRSLALPKRVVVDAAEAAMNVIQNYFKEANNEQNKVD